MPLKEESASASSPFIQKEASRGVSGGPTPSPDVLPDVLTLRHPASALHAAKMQSGSRVLPRISSPFTLFPSTLTGLVQLRSKIPRSRIHRLRDGKCSFYANGYLYTSAFRHGRLLGYISLLSLVAFFFFSDRSQSLLEKTVSTMARPLGLLHTLISLLVVTVAPSQSAVPPSFPSSGKALWYRNPAISWSKEYLPIGNGFLAGEPKHF